MCLLISIWSAHHIPNILRIRLYIQHTVMWSSLKRYECLKDVSEISLSLLSKIKNLFWRVCVFVYVCFFLRYECLKDVLKMSVVFLLASLFILNFCVFYTVAAQVINIHNSIHNIIQFHNHLTQYLLCWIIIWFQI